MQYIINRISEVIAEKEPAPDSESIILINGFESLKFYAELASRLSASYKRNDYSINIKIANRKWTELSRVSDTTTVQLMRQNGWVAENESVTFYRNQHNVSILILLGTEDEEDTGGLTNCFTITPEWLIADLDGHYSRVFEQCLTGSISDEERSIIDSAYRSLFEYCPIDIFKLSSIADEWHLQFDTINELIEEFGKTLPVWGLPGKTVKPYKPQNFKTKANPLHDAKDFISGKLFQRMSQKAYSGLVDKISKYSSAGQFGGNLIDWKAYRFKDFNDFAETLLEFARGERVQANTERLLAVDFTIVNDLLKFKTKGPSVAKVSETSIAGDPLEVILRTALSALKYARDESRADLAVIRFSFTSGTIVSGYTDIDDEEKRKLLAEIWRNICVHVNGVFEFINQNSWSYFGTPMRIDLQNTDFFDPQKVDQQIDNTVTVATGTNTLNKILFTVSLLDAQGNVLQESKAAEDKDLVYHYAWKFDSEAVWLYDFKDLIASSELTVPLASRIPVGVLRQITNMMVIKSPEEFFDLYEEDTIDLTYDLCDYVRQKIANTDDYELKQLGLLFTDLGSTFCKFASELSSKGFYHILCGSVLTELNEKYLAVAQKILAAKFDENMQWIKDAFLQSFVILDDTSYLSEEADPDCVIIPPWHPASLQKLSAQKRFLIDGLSQKVTDFDNNNDSLDISGILDRFIRMTEIQASIDLFPADGNDYMGVLGTYGHFCVYGNERRISSIKTRMKDVIRKEAIFDEEFKASELAKMNDDARMIYDVFIDYNRAMPSVRCALNIVFINPPDLQPIISAISKYTKDIHAESPNAIISIKLSILVRPENKGGKNYLTYWMDDYFSEDANTNVRIYLNEWSKRSELEKLLSENNDIVFNMDLLHAETFRFIPNPGDTGGKVSDCRFPIVYKPSPLSKTSKKRKIEITQTQFSAAFIYTQVVRYKKNPETIPQETYLAVRETSVEPETKQIIDMLHKKAYWVVCIDKVMDGALLRSDDDKSAYAIIGFSTGKGMYGQYNLTITARNSILETVEHKLKDRLYRLFKWKPDVLSTAVRIVMNEARSLDGISMLSAINQRGTNINEFMAYVMTSLRESKLATSSALKVIIHLDSYTHWFNNRGTSDSSMRPDFLMLSVVSSKGVIKLRATVIECKTAAYSNHLVHVEKALKQVEHGLDQLKTLFDPSSESIERRYWYAQLYRALVFAQVTFSDSSEEFTELSGKLRSILDGNFEIEWDGRILGYWVDLNGKEEFVTDESGISIYNIPQECIQQILTGTDSAVYSPVDDEILIDMDEMSDGESEQAAEQALTRKRNEILNRRKKPVEPTQRRKPHVSAEEPIEQQEPLSSNTGANALPNNPGETNGVTEESVDTTTTPDQNITGLSDARILIGKDRTESEVYWEFGNPGLSNRHLLITGTSGQGKTYGIQTMLYEISKSRVSMVVFDYTEGFRTDQLEDKFLKKMEGRIDNRVVYFTGVPIDPFKRYEIEVAGMKAPEKISDVAQRIASTLTHVYKFGDQQFAAIYDACYSGLSKYGEGMTMKLLESELNSSANKAAKTVVSKMTPFLHSVEFSDERCDWDDILYNATGKLTIFQLTSFVRDIQVIITEFMLWDMWHYAKKNGSKDRPFAVVLDEAQNLSHADNSPSGLILTEGRKFGWSAWYATQSLKVLNDDEVTRLMQSAFKLYFKPTDDEITSLAKQLNPSDTNEWKAPLLGLKKGECIVVGDRIQKDGKFKPSRPTITKVTSFDERE